MKYGNLTLGQVEALVNKIGGEQAVEAILRGGDISSELAALIIGQSTNGASLGYTVTVDRDKKLKAMIEAGRYDWTNSDITDQHFPVDGFGKHGVDIELVHYNRVMSTDDVLKDFDARGLRPAKVEELLALGASQPELQRQFPIIALGSVWQDLDGDRYCPCLGRLGSGRHLDLGWLGRGFRGRCRFAAVRK